MTDDFDASRLLTFPFMNLPLPPIDHYPATSFASQIQQLLPFPDIGIDDGNQTNFNGESMPVLKQMAYPENNLETTLRSPDPLNLSPYPNAASESFPTQGDSAQTTSVSTNSFTVDESMHPHQRPFGNGGPSRLPTPGSLPRIPTQMSRQQQIQRAQQALADIRRQQLQPANRQIAASAASARIRVAQQTQNRLPFHLQGMSNLDMQTQRTMQQLNQWQAVAASHRASQAQASGLPSHSRLNQQLAAAQAASRVQNRVPNYQQVNNAPQRAQQAHFWTTNLANLPQGVTPEKLRQHSEKAMRFKRHYQACLDSLSTVKDELNTRRDSLVNELAAIKIYLISEIAHKFDMITADVLFECAMAGQDNYLSQKLAEAVQSSQQTATCFDKLLNAMTVGVIPSMDALVEASCNALKDVEEKENLLKEGMRELKRIMNFNLNINMDVEGFLDKCMEHPISLTVINDNTSKVYKVATPDVVPRLKLWRACDTKKLALRSGMTFKRPYNDVYQKVTTGMYACFMRWFESPHIPKFGHVDVQPELPWTNPPPRKVASTSGPEVVSLTEDGFVQPTGPALKRPRPTQTHSREAAPGSISAIQAALNSNTPSTSTDTAGTSKEVAGEAPVAQVEFPTDAPSTSAASDTAEDDVVMLIDAEPMPSTSRSPEHPMLADETTNQMEEASEKLVDNDVQVIVQHITEVVSDGIHVSNYSLDLNSETVNSEHEEPSLLVQEAEENANAMIDKEEARDRRGAHDEKEFGQKDNSKLTAAQDEPKLHEDEKNSTATSSNAAFVDKKIERTEKKKHVQEGTSVADISLKPADKKERKEERVHDPSRPPLVLKVPLALSPSRGQTQSSFRPSMVGQPPSRLAAPLQRFTPSPKPQTNPPQAPPQGLVPPMIFKRAPPPRKRTTGELDATEGVSSASSRSATASPAITSVAAQSPAPTSTVVTTVSSPAKKSSKKHGHSKKKKNRGGPKVVDLTDELQEAPVEWDVDEDGHHPMCYTCHNRSEINQDPGMCDSCPRIYHSNCHIPRINCRMEDLPDNWHCSFCNPSTPTTVMTDNFTENERRNCIKVLLQCMIHPYYAAIFLEPVCLDSEPQYKKFVEKPMDFRTIGLGLEKSPPNGIKPIQNCLEFIHCMNLVFMNCSIYNEQETFAIDACKNVYADYVTAVKDHMPGYRNAVFLYIHLYKAKKRHSIRLRLDGEPYYAKDEYASSYQDDDGSSSKAEAERGVTPLRLRLDLQKVIKTEDEAEDSTEPPRKRHRKDRKSTVQ